MKLFSVIAAAATAQNTNIDFPDLSDFDLSAFNLPDFAPAALAPVAVAPANDERYFFTQATAATVTTQPITIPVTGDSCWKCDAMSYTQCASDGHLEQCTLGDKDCCFVEVREQKQVLKQLCTGCKDFTACYDNRDQNFEGPTPTHQCRPDYRQQKYGRSSGQQSVCRQCFHTCLSAEPDKCFGGLAAINTEKDFGLLFNTNEAMYPWNGHGPDNHVSAALGIPLHQAVADTLADRAATGIVEMVATPSSLANVYFHNAVDGKVFAPGQLFWGVQGASKFWWQADLRVIQNEPGLLVENFQE